MSRKRRAQTQVSEPMGQTVETANEAPKFAHASEREFARILDFYQIDWQYEPRTFALEWDENGVASVSFAPDFYLPELDLFIELTTLRQKLVTKKNRKLRRLRQLYPDINIKLFYNRDFKSLMSKYGIAFRAPAAPLAEQPAKENPSSEEEEG
ncbi:MAG: PDDEXK family nuclease [Chloroflexota bacterium]